MTIKKRAINADTCAYDDNHGSWMFRKGFEQGANEIVAIARVFLMRYNVSYEEFDKFIEENLK